ncbi:FAD/NAD(P)-binding domain-containing protein [Peniophora sp. CONT]|nr:FAD/NAD(P)-binding domain-containing protein [Peniophora sp. CONT]
MLSTSSPSVANDVYALHGRQIISHFLRKTRGYPAAPGPGIEIQLAPGNDSVNTAINMAVADMGDVGTHMSAAVEPVGILGAGPGGLYVALILLDLGIPFKVIEARDRVGGRLYTHEFPDKTGAPYNYFDVGAMRFPHISSMQRVFHLFHYDKLNSDGLALAQKLKKYTFECPDALLSYNGATIKRRDWKDDPFNSDTVIWDTEHGSAYVKARAEAIVSDVIEPFATRILDDLKTGKHAGWDYLSTYDRYSARAYMSTVYRPSASLRAGYPSLPDEPLSNDMVNWCETFESSTGSFDRAFTELVLESIAFGWKPKDPCQDDKKDDTEWYCIDKGAFQIADTMHQYLRSVRPEAFAFERRVTAIKMVKDQTGTTFVDVTTDYNDTQSFSHVISTIPLPVLRTIDLSGAGLSPMQSNALRELNYGPSVKVGMQFRTAWWTLANDKDGNQLNIVGGQSFTDTPLRTIVYPSFGDDTLKELVLRELANIHNVELSFLRDQLIDTFPWSWSQDPFTMGAFAFFGPGKFKSLYQSLTTPAAQNHLHFAGEALSTRHAWVEGALDSAWRAVFSMLFNEPTYQKYLGVFFARWGYNEEWIEPILTTQKPPVGRGGGETDGSVEEDELDVPAMLKRSLLVHHIVASSMA